MHGEDRKVSLKIASLRIAAPCGSLKNFAESVMEEESPWSSDACTHLGVTLGVKR